MIIRGEANGASIELSEPEGLAKPGGSESYRVTLRENEFEVSSRIYAIEDEAAKILHEALTTAQEGCKVSSESMKVGHEAVKIAYEP